MKNNNFCDSLFILSPFLWYCLSSLYMLAMRISMVFMAKNEKAGFAFVGQVIVRRCPALNGLLKENEK
jgi:hypothetical protein